MNGMLAGMGLLPWIDWMALVVFGCGWGGYLWFAKHRSGVHASILVTTNRIRRDWMLQITYREARVVDGTVLQNISSAPAFFASTTILIIGGLLAVVGTSERVTDLVRELPFAARTTTLVFDLKLALMLVVFVYAFFRFTWSMRLYGFGALLIGAAPDAGQFDAGVASREAFADRAGSVVALAAETFNDGLRAYYLALAAIGWFFSPVVFMATTAGVIYVLYRREFRSDVLDVLNS